MGKEDGGVDVLFEVRNAFHLGNYQQCINEAQKLRVNKDELKLIKDSYMYRAYIAQQKSSIPLDEISAPSLLPVRSLAEYLSNECKRSGIVEELENTAKAGVDLSETFLTCSAIIFMHEQNYDMALRLLNQSESLECQSLAIQCYLKLHRVDLAVKELKKMHEVDEDATLTQLTTAWVNMATGKDKLQDAFYIYQEMIDKYGETAMLLVAQSGCLIQQHKYDEAEKLINEALQRDSNNPEAIINMSVVCQCLGKAPELANRYINQMKEGHPNHPWTRDLVSKEQLFERVLLETAA